MSQIKGYFGFGRITQNAGTVIRRLIPGKKGLHTALRKLVVRAAGTAHVTTVMRQRGETTLTAAAAAGQAVIAVTTTTIDSDTVATNDLLAIQMPNGRWHLGVVSSVSSLNVTLTANVPTGGFSSGAKVQFFGVVGDSAHDNYDFTNTASQNTTFEAGSGSEDALIVTKGQDECLLIEIDNATNAGFLEQANGFYTPHAGGSDPSSG